MQNANSLAYFAGLIGTELRIVYADHNYVQLQNLLDEIAKLLDLNQIENLYENARSGLSIQMRQLLMDVATNSET